MSPDEIWQAAQVLISQHGERAYSVAADNFAQLQRVGNNDGAAIWVAIMIAITKLQENEPRAGDM